MREMMRGIRSKGDLGVLGSLHAGEPEAPVFHGAGGSSGNAEGRARLDHQPELDRVDDSLSPDAGVRHREGRNRGMTRTLAHEAGGEGVRVNAVLPGAILTERQRQLWFTEEYKQEILSRQAIKRMILPEEVAKLILFLASDESLRSQTRASSLTGMGVGKP